MSACKTGKVRYRDELGAKIALANTTRTKSRQSAAKSERKAYRCKDCHGWHLTSQR